MVVRQCPWGAWHTRRCPLGERPRRRVMFVLAADASMKTRRAVMLGGDIEAQRQQVVRDQPAELAVVVDHQHGHAAGKGCLGIHWQSEADRRVKGRKIYTALTFLPKQHYDRAIAMAGAVRAQARDVRSHGQD